MNNRLDSFKLQELINKVTPYQQHLETLKGWEQFRKEHPYLDLPHSNTLKKYYGSWNKVKAAFGLKVRKNWSSMSKKQIIPLLKPHIHALRGTPNDWENYLKENGLEQDMPGVYPLIHVFESWNKLKHTFSLEVKEAKKTNVYTREEIINMIKQYPPHIFSARAWERFRKEHSSLSLPTFMTILRYVSKEELETYKQNWKEDD